MACKETLGLGKGSQALDSGDWRRFCWSDESKIERSKDPRTVWVFAAPEEQYKPECVKPEMKGPDIWLIVWGCFYGHHKETFVPIVVNVNQHIYKMLLDIACFQ